MIVFESLAPIGQPNIRHLRNTALLIYVHLYDFTYRCIIVKTYAAIPNQDRHLYSLSLLMSCQE